MSLFSRLDRVRTGREKDDRDQSGMFSVPDLGPRDNSSSAQTEPPLIESVPDSQMANSQTPSPIAAIPVQLPPREQDEAEPEASTAEVETELSGVADQPPVENQAPTSIAGETARPEVEVAPVSSSEPEVSVIETAAPAAPSISPFDRLMTERGTAPAVETSVAETSVSGPEEPRPLTLAERLAARNNPPVSPTSTPTSAAPTIPATLEAPTFEAEPPLDPETPVPFATPEALAEEALAEEALAAPESAEEVETEVQAGLSSDFAPESLSSVANLPENPTSSVPMNPSIPPNDSIERVPPSTPAPVSRGIFADRLAARETLDRDLQMPSNEPAPRVPSELARVEDEAQLPEREMKVRVLYRQKHLIFDSVLGNLDPRILQNPTRDSLKPAITKAVDGALREFNLAMEPSERNWMVEEFLRETADVGPLVTLLEDPGVSKIIVTGANDVSVERLGQIQRTGVSFRDDDHLLLLVRRIAEMTGGRIDAKVPLLDRPLPDGARIRAKVPPLAPVPTLTIEKSTGNPFVALKRQQAERSRGESLPYNQLRERIQLRLLREFEGNSAVMSNQERLRGQVEEMIGQVILEEKIAVTRAEKASLVMDLLNEIVGLGPIEPLLNDPDVDEIMVNGPFQIYVERKGKLELSNQRFRDNNHAMQVIERIIAPLGRRIDEKSPMVDGRLRDGSRFNAIIPPLALSGPTMTIRKFARDPFTMTDLINFGSLTREAAQFLQAAVEGRLNIVVSGGTGSGKTTTLNVLSSFIPSDERIVTIEDAAELQLRQEHIIRLETRPANIEGVGEINIRDLVRNALRMRPDRIVIGECRGGEALDMLQAMNTGHDGSLTTGHSNGPRDTLKRLETMVMMSGFDLPVKAIREQIAMAVHLIVHQERMRDGKRRVTAVTEIVGMEGDVITMQDLFRFEQERIDDDGKIIGALVPTGLRPKNWDTIVDHGVELSMDMFSRRPSEGMQGRLNGRGR